MSHAAADAVAYRIAVAETVARAYRAAHDNWRLAVALAWAPVVIMFAAELIAGWLDDGRGFGPPFADLLRGAAFVVFSSLFGVRWYRFVLLGDSQHQGFFPPGFAGFLIIAIRFTLLLIAGAVLLAVIVAVIAFAIAPALAIPLGFAGGLIVMLIAGRVSLVFPAAAIQRPLGFEAAWNLLAGNYWRFVVCATACYLPFAIAQTIFLHLGKALPWPIAILCQAIEVIVIFAGSAVSAGMISEVYRNIAGVIRTVAGIPD